MDDAKSGEFRQHKTDTLRKADPALYNCELCRNSEKVLYKAKASCYNISELDRKDSNKRTAVFLKGGDIWRILHFDPAVVKWLNGMKIHE